MNTQDDTFNRLRRLPIQEMAKIIVDTPMGYCRLELEKYGWAFDDFCKECRVYNKED